MEKSASTLSHAKFARLTPRQQHKVLAQWALSCLDDDVLTGFDTHYRRLTQDAELDLLRPPTWLTEREAIEEHGRFHARLAGIEWAWDLDITGARRALWQPRFKVEVVLDRVRSPFNVGSILRGIDAFGFRGLRHASDHLDLSHPRLVKAARGAQAWVPVNYEADLPGFLEDYQGTVIGLERHRAAVSILEWDPPAECAVVLGHESDGISQALMSRCDQWVELPSYGFKHTMSVQQAMVAFGMAYLMARGSS